MHYFVYGLSKMWNESNWLKSDEKYLTKLLQKSITHCNMN